jgi:hypothetical protein
MVCIMEVLEEDARAIVAKPNLTALAFTAEGRNSTRADLRNQPG